MCQVCPCAYCEDDVPTEYEGRMDLDRSFELEQTGYSQPSSAFFITCSQSCTQYYKDYQDGKFDDSSETVTMPIPVDLIEEEHVKQAAEEAKRKEEADKAVAAAAAAPPATKRGARKSKKVEAEEAAAAAAAAAAAEAALAKEQEEQKAESEVFVYAPPKELPPHVCACLMPKKGQCVQEAYVNSCRHLSACEF